MEKVICPINQVNLKQLKKSCENKYPSDQNLPWHFSWIDDGMIAGMSVPCDRNNYPALKAQGVELIVNLMESPVTMNRPYEYCKRCQCDQSTEFDADLFADANGFDVLWLPVFDGAVPRVSQIEIFLRNVMSTIEQGGKVAVHCQAGVGRTGIFLCIYLMIKYRLSPGEAIRRLRKDRPQSMQYNPNDWYSNPFYQYKPLEFKRNLIQERFIYWYHRNYAFNYFGEFHDRVGSVDTLVDSFSLISLKDVEQSTEFEDSDSECSLEADQAFEDEWSGVLHYLERGVNEFDSPENLCHACKNVISVGPSPIIPYMDWPPFDAPIIFS